jgi:hypothetical protein
MASLAKPDTRRLPKYSSKPSPWTLRKQELAAELERARRKEASLADRLDLYRTWMPAGADSIRRFENELLEASRECNIVAEKHFRFHGRRGRA